MASNEEILTGLADIVEEVAGVAVASMRHHENLVGAMISGRKRSPEQGDIG